MSGPKVAVCVPAYNTARYIKQCIESVFAQEFKDWVLRVSDNCSTDGMWEILHAIPSPAAAVVPAAGNRRARIFWV
jgi:glycosyltransferase involved in cell wall biosynthesis